MATGKTSYHHNNLREELIQAGIQIIDEEGYEQLSLRRAAVMCGVSHAAPKNHFSNKEEFCEAIKKHVADEFAAYLQRAVEQSTDDRLLLRDIGRAYIQFFEDNPQCYHLIVEQKDISIHISEQSIEDSEYQPFQVFQVNASRVLREMGVPDAILPKFIIELWAIVNGLVSLRMMKGFYYDGDWMAMVNQIICQGLPPIEQPIID